MSLTTNVKPVAETADDVRRRKIREAMLATAGGPRNSQALTAQAVTGNPQGAGDPTNTGIDLQGNQAPDDYATDRLINYAKQTKAENRNYIDQNVSPYVDNYGDAADVANNADRAALVQQSELADHTVGGIDDVLGKVRNLYGGYANQMQGLNESDQGALGSYLGTNKSLLQDLQGGKLDWQDAQSAQEGLGAQREALAKYKSLSDPTMTAQERFLSEGARRKQEQQEQSTRDAVMGDLKARGMGGSGLELTNMLGAQQQLSQQRTLSELGAQSNAVERSMQAVEGFGNTANQMRQNGDIINMFNAQNGQAARQWVADKTNTVAGDARKAVTDTNEGIGKRATDTYGEGAKTLSGEYQAVGDKYGIRQRTINGIAQNGQNQFQRAGNVAGSHMDLGQLWTGGNRADSGAVFQGYSTKAGNAVADAAVDQAEKDTPFIDIPFVNGKFGGRTYF